MTTMTTPSCITHLAARRIRAIAATTLTIILSTVAVGRAQGQGGPAPTPVPLSGRSAPGGSVVATQTAVPGATTSVDTITPVVQVQGAFTGSTRRGAVPPLQGPLTLQEALRRGVEYNLGAL